MWRREPGNEATSLQRSYTHPPTIGIGVGVTVSLVVIGGVLAVLRLLCKLFGGQQSYTVSATAPQRSTTGPSGPTGAPRRSATVPTTPSAPPPPAPVQVKETSFSALSDKPPDYATAIAAPYITLSPPPSYS